jgi:hypothetical protein
VAARLGGPARDWVASARRGASYGAAHYTTGLRNVFVLPDASDWPTADLAPARAAQQALEIGSRLG